MAQADITRIASNIAGLNSLNALNEVNAKLGIHQLRLATGKRINEAADDPAGLTIATKFNAKSRGLGVALDNIGDAKNLLSVAEAGLTKINDILLVIRDKTEQAANDALGGAEREAIRKQIDELLTEIDEIVNETEWNRTKLIDGGEDAKLNFQTGYLSEGTTEINLDKPHTVEGLGVSLGGEVTVFSVLPGEGDETSDWGSVVTGVDIKGVESPAEGKYTVTVKYTEATGGDPEKWTITLEDSDGDEVGKLEDLEEWGSSVTIEGFVIKLGEKHEDKDNDITQDFTISSTTETVDVSSNQGATAYMEKIDDAIATVSDSIAKIGASVSRLTFKEETLVVAKINTEAAYSRIMNADMAAEQLEATKLQILQQTATAMLAQANVAPQAILALFR
ncbi:MAG: flagellin protein [Firmicutes bacterium]|nr:flagellin protein [Bacillota bacterium]